MSDKKCQSDLLLLFWLTLFSPFFIFPGISLFSTKINQAWPGYIVASSFHIQLRVRRGESSLMALVNLWLYSIYTYYYSLYGEKKFREINFTKFFVKLISRVFTRKWFHEFFYEFFFRFRQFSATYLLTYT